MFAAMQRQESTTRDQWEWMTSDELAATRPTFTAAEMLSAPDQAANPPTENEEVVAWWEEQDYTLKGTVLIKASMIPPEIKARIRQGLISKRLTWEYLLSGRFLEFARHPAVNKTDVLIVLESVMLEDVKSDAGQLLEQETEQFWRTRTTPGNIAFDQKVADVMKKCDLDLSSIMMEGKRHGEQLRSVTHGGGCLCWSCQFISQGVEGKFEKDAWESFRLQKRRMGEHIMSYKQYMEIENGLVSDSNWSDIQRLNEILTDPRYVGKPQDPNVPKRKLGKKAFKEP